MCGTVRLHGEPAHGAVCGNVAQPHNCVFGGSVVYLQFAMTTADESFDARARGQRVVLGR
jgi:hypothetical protein